MSDSGSHFQDFDKILGGRLGKKKASSALQPTESAGQPLEDSLPAGDEKTTSEESFGRRHRRRSLRDESDDDISVTPSQPRWSEAIDVFRSVHPSTGKASLSCAVLPLELQRVIRRLKTPVAYHSTTITYRERSRMRRNSVEDDAMVFDEPFHSLYFARAELTKHMNEARPMLSRRIGELLDFVNNYFKDVDAELEKLGPRGSITYRLLWTLFPPGTLVYLRQPTLFPGLEYEQCSVVQSTSYRQTPQANKLFIYAKEWCFTGSGYHRVVVADTVAEFQGVQTISSEKLHYLPFASLSQDLQFQIKKRLIERAKRYLELFARPASVWEYEGPARLLPTDDITSVLTDTFQVPDVFPGNWTVKERVVVESRLMGKYYGYLAEEGASVPTLDLSMPIDEETYLTFSGHVCASLLDNKREAARLILSRLRPVRWEPDALEGAEVTQMDSILHQVRKFSPRNRLIQPPVGVTPPNAGLVFWLKGPLVKNESFVRNIAESAEKPFVQKDLLRFLGGGWTDGPVLGLLASLKDTIQWQCVIFIENCGIVMERRQIDNPERSSEITQFFDMLSFYPGILFLSPGNIKDPDPLFEDFPVVHV